MHGSVPYTIRQANPLFEPWRWKTFAELNDKGIRCLVEGRDQSMWFGTAKGIFHYDGLKWQNYYEINEVLTAPVYGLCYTKDDILFAVTSKGICHFANGNWQTDLLFPDRNVLGSEWEVLNIIETENGEVWVGLYFGLIRIMQKKFTLFTTPAQIEGIEQFFKEVEIVDMTGVFEDTEAFIVFDILEDNTGNLWLGMEDGTTIRLYDKNHNPRFASHYTKYSEKDNMLISRLPVLYESHNGRIFNISQSIRGGVNIFDYTSETWNSFPLSSKFGGDDLNFSICETNDGILWIGGLSRFFTREDEKWIEYKQPDLPVPPTRIILYPTSDGSLWMVGHMADVIRIGYNTPTWGTYQGLLYQCETSDGTQWFLNAAGKVVLYDQTNETWNVLEDYEFPMSDPNRIFIDNSSTLWATGTHEGNAAVAWNSAGTWNLKTFPDLCWGFHPGGIVQTKDNSIWFGANADCGDKAWGIVRYTPSKGNPSVETAWHHYKGNEISEVAYALSETDDQKLLSGSYLGLYEFNGRTTRSLHDVLMHDIIKIESMAKDPAGGVWIGTRSQGVIHYVNDTAWIQYTSEQGLVSNSVSSILVSEDSTLWVATDKGVSRFDRNKWTKWALPEQFHISRGNGMLEKGTNNSIWIALAPIEWYRRVFYNRQYSTENSPLISYQISPETDPPETEITKYDKKVYYPGNAIIHWQGIDKWNDTDPEKLQYSFRLDNKPWSDYTTEKSQTFLSLRRGWHKLEVRSRDNFLNVDLTPSVIKFKVIPPVWGQIWFLLLIVFFISAIGYLMFSSFRKNRKMEAQNTLMKQKNEDLIKQQQEIEKKGKQIMELLEKERENQWLNEGILLTNEILKKYGSDLKKLASAILEKLIDYLQVNAGGILLYRKDDSGNKDKDFLELIAAFGYNKERLESKKMHPDEGLTGACYREKKTMIVDNIPDDYFVGSGLGKAKLAQLILVPLKMLEDIVGIIEISSLKKMEPRKVKLLELVAENIASNILNMESRAKIEKMYEISKQQTEQLHEQEEELRQQMEELQATQEESRRREEDLLKELKECRKQKKSDTKKKSR
jgi:ligand-binding sensor domain-containing protein